MKYVTELSIFLPNEPGELAELLKELSENEINVRAISVVETADYGLILLLVDKPQKCIDYLEQNGYEFTSTEVIAIKFGKDASDLFNVANSLGNNKINIDYLYLTTTPKYHSVIIVKVDDPDKAIDVLQKQDFELIEGDDL
jgi:hypothetical protein